MAIVCLAGSRRSEPNGIEHRLQLILVAWKLPTVPPRLPPVLRQSFQFPLAHPLRLEALGNLDRDHGLVGKVF